MFGFIKWLIIFLILGTVFYIGDFFLNVDQDFIKQAKLDTMEAIDSGKTESLLGSVERQVKLDLKNKKETLSAYLKEKLKGIFQ